jgi:GTP-binding protein Era
MEPSPPHRSGFVAVVGRPNAGKSTLLNALVGQKVAGVSPWPQTTRRRQMGVLTLPDAQILFLDTPGWHKPKTALGDAMVHASLAALSDADVVLFLADLTQPVGEEDRELARKLTKQKRGDAMLMAFNKTDAVTPPVRAERSAEYQSLLPESAGCFISARDGDGLPELLREIAARLPEGPMLYPEEEVTDFSEREIVADLIREAALRNLWAEVPHGVAVRVDEYKERGEEGAYIEATIFVEKESHKAIVIGKGGAMMKAIGTEARKKAEAMSGRKIFLQLRVKVLPGWRNQEDALRRLGYLPKQK